MKFKYSIWLAVFLPLAGHGHSVARLWNEQNLDAIRVSFPNPPVHARNLFHVSVAMWDAWSAYDPVALAYLHHETPASDTIAADRDIAVSYAAFRVLRARYATSHGWSTIEPALNQQMIDLGLDPNFTSLEGTDPAALGNRVAATVLGFALDDGSNESGGYQDSSYAPVNSPMIVDRTGTTMNDPNRWQPLALAYQVSQNGIPIPSAIQTFVGPHWGGVRPFALVHQDGQLAPYLDPGYPPRLNTETEAEFMAGSVDVVRRSSWLDPDQNVLIDISPGAMGNNPLGANDGIGHALNPVTGLAYSPNVVNRGDFGRVVAEFWADGPDSETPPGHWNTLANSVVDHPDFERRLGGSGPVLEELEWDVKMYFAINGALHDAAVAAWGCKRVYDYVRPISSIRYMGGLGQSTNPSGPSYHPYGLPLEAGLVELITDASSQPGERHQHLRAHMGKIAVYSWGGEPAHKETQYTGAVWMLAGDWMPYQRDTFVTPAFAGYVSGHSTFSRAAAEVLTRLTGSAFFPGGIASHTAGIGSLEFELGPSEEVVLQWATYYDAADQAGISRLYGGIHVPADDGPGRIMGSACGIAAFEMASKYFDGTILNQPFNLTISHDENSGDMELRWDSIRGMTHRVEESNELGDFRELLALEPAPGVDGHLMITPNAEPLRVFRIVRQPGNPPEE